MSNIALIQAFSAHDDSSVVHHHEFNSQAPISDSSDESTTSPVKKKLKKSESKEDVLNLLLQSAVSMMQMKVELAKHCDECDDEDRRRCFNRDEWQQAMMMLEHGNPVVWAEGEALVKELHAQHGVKHN